ncbi:MAG: DUF2304 domain-containing protein [Eubacterium sp.]|nr:DUF2304 domain-containing protein [Eubacterium sp.]
MGIISPRFVIVLFVIVYFVALIVLLKKKRLALKYSLLWIFCGVLFLIAAAFPGLLVFITSLVGIEVPTNGLFAIAILFLILILMSITVIVSETSARIKTLVQKISLMEKRIRELENKN